MNEAICCFFGLATQATRCHHQHLEEDQEGIQGGMAAYLSRGVEAAGARDSLGGDAWMTADSGSASAAAAAGSGGVGVKVETASCWSAILVLSTIRGVPFIREIDGRTAPGCSAGTDIDMCTGICGACGIILTAGGDSERSTAEEPYSASAPFSDW